MPKPIAERLQKVCLNLYETDCLEAEQRFGHGWSSHLREVWHQYLQQKPYQKLKLGDLE